MGSDTNQLRGQRAILVGNKGWVANERYVLRDNDPVTVGRSRSCDISLRRIANYLQQPPGKRDNDHDFNTVSRRHIRITVHNAIAHIEDLSTNGTYYNNIQATGPIDIDLREGGIEIRLGTRETFLLTIEAAFAGLKDSDGFDSSLLPDSMDAPRSHDPLEMKD